MSGKTATAGVTGLAGLTAVGPGSESTRSGMDVGPGARRAGVVAASRWELLVNRKKAQASMFWERAIDGEMGGFSLKKLLATAVI